ncbi:hypothetical protein A3C89_02605 [Candidatus Kaiserbacteria bacterium RIFCSPHIGHO2_02_FULL_50_50]|uniref:Uncharacterized protein n=1 Tax=Candidatus Kaiserbacteria bacterium RIFCSPHIGHO2_02_FULL_50_50 TaxID=1798492 RepID=A0A1F6DDH6_9BACT|nr:MAG: hypothetical protein A3C89_02605 [Candidatus Kaiserbacteria bacterium RIFCSPHIGHO2_02_FULL_50_50]OGG88004.1 MAG: hypothetical protein A3G62_03620 [Candidatus Kaiserbacteria bacterium RIFCSPLOWO2_12_FULL_50_10]
MTTTAIFNIDAKLKAAAQKKAREQGIPFSSVLTFATRAYVNNTFTVDFVAQEIEASRATKKVSSANARKLLGL